MIEQQLAERLRAVVVDEPPLTRDLGEFVDELVRPRRRLLVRVGRRRPTPAR